MDVLVIGFGTSGKSACRYLLKKGYTVFAVDDQKTSCELEQVNFLPAQDVAFNTIAFVVLSPGISLEHPLVVQAKKLGLEVFCDMELAFRECVKGSPPMCAITATNGKTTTTMLTCHMLNSAKCHAKAVGNIGLPLLDVLEEPNCHFVAELSSFQLQTMKTAVLQAACILNITPNHLDHHASYSEYVESKQRIALCLKDSGTLYVNEKAARDFSWNCPIVSYGFSSHCAIYTDGKFIYRLGKKEASLPQELQGSFSHHTENFLAAYVLARDFGVDPYVCVEAYASFQKPKHRIEFVARVHGVSFYDDSKATNVDAVLRALDSFTSPVVLIAGGVHKGFSYEAWKEPCSKKVSACILLGQAADIISQDLGGCVPLHKVASLEEAVRLSMELAKAGDSVLLSPGCSSYDMFKNYEERGKQFQQLVHQLDQF